MKEYEKIPKKVRHHMAVIIIAKTIIDNMEQQSKMTELYSKKYGAGIAGCRIKVGTESLMKITELSKEAWKVATGGKLKIDGSAIELVYLLSELIPKKDHFDLFLIKPIKPYNMSDEQLDYFSKYVLSIEEFLIEKLDVERPCSKLVIKKQKKEKKNKGSNMSKYKKTMRRSKEQKINMKKTIVISMLKDTLIIEDRGFKHNPLTIYKDDKLVSFGDETYYVKDDIGNLSKVFDVVYTLTNSIRYNNIVIRTIVEEWLDETVFNFEDVKVIKFKGL